MKVLGGLLTLLIALIIEGVAGYFSVVGLGALFAGAFWSVIIMGASLEAGKVVAATWLKANWSNPRVKWIQKAQLLSAVLALMALTSLGIYGYLAKAHLEQEAPIANIDLQIKQGETRIDQFVAERTRAEARLRQLDDAVNTILGNSKTSQQAVTATRIRDSQRKERATVQQQITSLNSDINAAADTLVPLRRQVSDVSAKLGPVKYVASLFGWTDPNSAVQLIIGLIMFAFDPLAIVMVLSGTQTLSEALEARAARRAAKRVVEAPVTRDPLVMDTVMFPIDTQALAEPVAPVTEADTHLVDQNRELTERLRGLRDTATRLNVLSAERGTQLAEANATIARLTEENTNLRGEDFK